MKRSDRKTVSVDVDGVLHSYASGWQGIDRLTDPPVRGAIEWLENITHDFDVAVCSTRNTEREGRQAIRRFLVEHGLSDRALGAVSINAGKPPALLYVDDRAWRFTGANFPSVGQIRSARPWWYR